MKIFLIPIPCSFFALSVQIAVSSVLDEASIRKEVLMVKKNGYHGAVDNACAWE
jgi:hypothetical protein